MEDGDVVRDIKDVVQERRWLNIETLEEHTTCLPYISIPNVVCYILISLLVLQLLQPNNE